MVGWVYGTGGTRSVARFYLAAKRRKRRKNEEKRGIGRKMGGRNVNFMPHMSAIHVSAGRSDLADAAETRQRVESGSNHSLGRCFDSPACELLLPIS
jgi:hypothetical protein